MSALSARSSVHGSVRYGFALYRRLFLRIVEALLREREREREKGRNERSVCFLASASRIKKLKDFGVVCFWLCGDIYLRVIWSLVAGGIRALELEEKWGGY